MMTDRPGVVNDERLVAAIQLTPFKEDHGVKWRLLGVLAEEEHISHPGVAYAPRNEVHVEPAHSIGVGKLHKGSVLEIRRGVGPRSRTKHRCAHRCMWVLILVYFWNRWQPWQIELGSPLAGMVTQSFPAGETYQRGAIADFAGGLRWRKKLRFRKECEPPAKRVRISWLTEPQKVRSAITERVRVAGQKSDSDIAQNSGNRDMHMGFSGQNTSPQSDPGRVLIGFCGFDPNPGIVGRDNMQRGELTRTALDLKS